VVRRRESGGARGGALRIALQFLDAVEGDFVFVTLHPSEYDLVARRRREVATDDALGQLLWGCGIDPNDAEARERPWAVVSRAVGGGESTREDVRGRLIERKNFDLVGSLDRVGGTRRPPEPADPTWADGWEFTSPMTNDNSMFALENGNGTIRVALGFPNLESDHPGLLVDSTGLTWVERPDQGHWELPAELPSERWVQWKRAEHHAVRCALAGERWRIVLANRGWQTEDGRAHASLTEALLSLAPANGATPPRPTTPIHGTSARSAFAYERLVTRALRRGLADIRADADGGLVATFADGGRAIGLTLTDLLS
jgi:hypothetical protein